jgi:hypothetical protein
MGQWSGGTLGSPYSRGSSAAPAGATSTTPASSEITEPPPSAPYSAPAYAIARGPAVGASQGLQLIRLAGAVVAVLLLAAVIGLTVVYVGAKSKLGSTRSALAAARAQLLSVQVALAGDMKALQTEQAVGTYMRGVRDALAPALAAYSASGSASSAAAARANDEQAIAALTSAKQKVAALVLPDSLRSADGDIRAAMDALAGGLQSEVTAIGTGNLGGLDAAVMIEGQALEHLQTALGEMYSAVGTAGPASGTS